ncbi:MAG: hypothetical protein Q9160_008570 [Pyrenula sp. 1 TL-2023]
MPDGRTTIATAAFCAGAFVTLALTALYQAEPRPKLSNRKDSEDPTRSTPPAIGHGIESTIGNTPLIKIKSLSSATGCTILAKAESLNGAGNSPKDRVALSIITRAEADGLLTPFSGDTVYEGTVGSTGISLATLCRARGYLAHICMPDDVAAEKAELLEKLGAVVEKVRPAPIVDQGHFVNVARRRAEEHGRDPGKRGRGFFADQFETEANWRAHFEEGGTGGEIWEQTGGEMDVFVAGAGTGGTVSGVARCLKERKRGVRVVLADPQGSGAYNKVVHGVMFHDREREGTRRRHQTDTLVEGIGLTRSTANFEAGRELIDDAVKVTDAQSMAMARWLVEKDGIFAGSSTAVNCFAAAKVALEGGPGQTIVTLLCDSGSRYLSKFWKEAGNVGGTTSTTLEQVMNVSD